MNVNRLVSGISSLFLVVSPGALLGETTGPANDWPMEKPAPATAETPQVVDQALLEQTDALPATEMVRVLVFLETPTPSLAGARSFRHSEASSEAEAIRAEIDKLLQEAARDRAPSEEAVPDSAQFENLQEAWGEERERLRELSAQHEELSAQVQAERSDQLRAAVSNQQKEVSSAMEPLGAEVEFTTTAGNTIIARVPAGSIEAVAQLPGVVRVAEDTLAHSHLSNADDATRVSSINSLWPNGFTGGAYDPAVVDSGTDLSHPFLNNSAGRDNHWSWYLVAGAAHPNFNDIADIDDVQGHGTHVVGIVASEGSTNYPALRGMSYGVEKAVHLKAGWRNSATGGASMFWSDKMWLVDRTLNRPQELRPNFGVDVFNDDVDGFNLSYGGSTTSDDPSGGRFWDAVVDDYADMVVTISAGNSGPSNSVFNDPATSYNAITVANVDDRNTATRDDDTIRASSTRGPTAAGRRKPDIGAPGTSIASANFAWETQADYLNATGTSMAAPMILGIAMDLMEAGVTAEKSIKALLLNTAQKNEPGINFEGDADGWSTAYGWGYVNGWSAYYHRSDVRTQSVTPRGTANSYDLYAGNMRDEGTGGEGRDRATLVWNRHAVYRAHDYPTTSFPLNDLDLFLFSQANGSLIDGDVTVRDNVHQVRVNSGTPAGTAVVVKVAAFSSAFSGVSAEPYALATEEGFSLADPPTFSVALNHPNPVQPSASFTITAQITNNGDVPAFGNQVTLNLPSGFSIISGSNPRNIGRVASGASSNPSWVVRAASTPGTRTLSAVNQSSSYGESYQGSRSRTITVGTGPMTIASHIGLYNPGLSRFYLRDTNSAGPANTVFGFGPGGAGWQPITGDWDGDNDSTIGLYNPGLSRFYLRNTNNGGAANVVFSFGPGGAGWVPITGDWDGDGDTTIGLYNPAMSRFYLRNTNNGGAANVVFNFGPGGAGWVPITGDWDGDGDTTVGLYNPALSRFYLRNTNNGGAANMVFGFGPGGAGWLPITGAW